MIVNSIARDLQLDKGPLSKALLAKAGAELQVELTQESQGKDIKEGCVLKTSGYALSCLHVLHAILPAWNRRKKSESKVKVFLIPRTHNLVHVSLTFTRNFDSF